MNNYAPAEVGRPHQSLGQDSPFRERGDLQFERSKIMRSSVVDGLKFDYSMAI
jgi:hypothetical protein